MDARHQARFWQLVREHAHAVNATTSALTSLPSTARPFASTLAMSRFLNSEHVTLPALIEPAHDAVRAARDRSDEPVALVVHDWCMIQYRAPNADRYRRSHAADCGYELGTALVLDSAAGHPLGPMEVRVRTAREVVSTRPTAVACVPGHVDELAPVMGDARRWHRPRPAVHVIDREADSVDHYRHWARAGHTFLVRADRDRVVTYDESEVHLSRVTEQPGVTFRRCTDGAGAPLDVTVGGATGAVWVADVRVVLHRPGKKRVGRKQVEVPGDPLELRLVVSWVVASDGEVLAEWFLLTNASSSFDGITVARWYAWRWRIESYHTLLKSAGMNAERWGQESGEAVARRLVVASMACVSVWCLQRDASAAGAAVRAALVRLSGRQMKWGVAHTAPALLAGLEKLLAVLDLLRTHDLVTLVAQARSVLPNLFNDAVLHTAPDP
jgi:hypothetical protein